MSYSIEHKTGRAALPYRAAPYFKDLGGGAAVGVRIGKTGAQTWVARCRVGDKQEHQPLGALHHVDDKTRFTHACDLARQFASKLTLGIQADAGTVWAACLRYIEQVRKERGGPAGERAADSARRMLAYNIEGHTLGGVPLDKLTQPVFSQWRDWLVSSRLGDDFDPDDEDAGERERKARATASRVIASTRAALNLARKDGYVDTDRAWRDIGKFRKVDGSRKRLLTMDEVKRIEGAAASDMREFIAGLRLTGFRPGEIARLIVGDFDAKAGIVHIRESKTGARSVHLHAEALALFKRMARGKTPRAPLFAMVDGGPWRGGNDWRPAWREAVERSDVPEDENEPLVPYHVRHAVLSHLIAHGVNLKGLADMAGTSLQMLDLTYGKNLAKVTNAQIAAAFG